MAEVFIFLHINDGEKLLWGWLFGLGSILWSYVDYGQSQEKAKAGNNWCFMWKRLEESVIANLPLSCGLVLSTHFMVESNDWKPKIWRSGRSRGLWGLLADSSFMPIIDSSERAQQNIELTISTWNDLCSFPFSPLRQECSCVDKKERSSLLPLNLP